MLVVTCTFGTLVGLIVCYRVYSRLNHSVPRRICMINSMTLPFLFSTLIVLSTHNTSLAVLVPTAAVFLPIVVMAKSADILDFVEISAATIMSASMSEMLSSTMNHQAFLSLMLFLVVCEILLFFGDARYVRTAMTGDKRSLISSSTPSAM